jgi:hypothetical protein
MRSVYLAGTAHRYQRDSTLVPESQIEELRKMLREIIEQKGIRGIAEEMSKDGLPFSRNRRSVGKQLADQLGLAHDYSDPDEATRKALSIEKDKQGDPKRERYWLERLQSFVEFPILFILGARHFESFASLLTQSGFQVFEVVRDWKPSSPSEADAWLEWIERRDASTETSALGNGDGQ